MNSEIYKVTNVKEKTGDKRETLSRITFSSAPFLLLDPIPHYTREHRILRQLRLRGNSQPPCASMNVWFGVVHVSTSCLTLPL